jgi:protein arginine N-methyltransferase 1
MLIEFHRRMLADPVRSAAFHEALRRVIRPGESTVADVGAGTGFLGFLARRLGAREVHLIEHGPVIALAEELADRNRLDGLHFWPMHSGEILDELQVDVVVAEVLGNLALEENAIETLADARRFLKPGGVLIPQRIEQYVAPVTTGRFRREIDSWNDVGYGLDFEPARRVSCDNVYVHRMTPADLLATDDAAQAWDALDFATCEQGMRRGTLRWHPAQSVVVHGFCMWWRCELVPGVELTTSPYAAPTHWDQVLLPLTEPVACAAGDTLDLTIESETGGGQAGIAFCWELAHRRGGTTLRSEAHDIARGALGP